MPRSSKALAAENAALREQIARLAAVPQTPSRAPKSTELWVGIRNISHNTVSVPSPFPNEPPLDLHADVFPDDPGRVAAISYAWWLQLRKSPLVEKGLLMRDDSVLAASYEPGPADRPEDLPKLAAVNAVPDVKAWIDVRSEDQIKDDLKAITSEHTLRRLRAYVDDALRAAAAVFPVSDDQRVKKAYRNLPAKLQFLDTVITERLERPEE